MTVASGLVTHSPIFQWNTGIRSSVGWYISPGTNFAALPINILLLSTHRVIKLGVNRAETLDTPKRENISILEDSFVSCSRRGVLVRN